MGTRRSSPSRSSIWCVVQTAADILEQVRPIDPRSVRAPVSGYGAPPRARLAALGVARITFGASLFRRALAEAERVLAEF